MKSTFYYSDTSKRPSILLSVSLLAAFLFFLTGCCGKKNSEGSNTGKQVKLVFWNTMEGAEAEAMPAILAEFSKLHPEIQIEQVMTNFYETKSGFKKAVRDGVAPDIVRADRFWIADFASSGVLSAIEEKQIKKELEEMVPVAKEVIRYDNNYWAMPISVDSLAMFYNKKLFKKYNISPPTNFDEFAEHAKLMTEENTGQYGFFIYPNGWYFEPFYYGFGGQYFNESGELVFDYEVAKKSFQFLLHLKENLRAVPPINFRDKVYNTMIKSFGNGKIGMIFSGPWAINSIIKGSAFRDSLENLGIAPLPAGPYGTFSPTGCQTLAISSSSKYKPEALKFLKYMFSYDVQKRLSMANYGMPANRKVFSAPELKNDPYLQTFIRQLQISRKIVTKPNQGNIYEPLGEKLKSVLNGEISTEYAISDFIEEWKNKYEK